MRRLKIIEDWVNVSATDPEDARKRGLLNLILFALAGLVLIMLVLMVLADLFNLTHDQAGLYLVYLGGSAFLLGVCAIYLINRNVSGDLASLIFLLLISAMLPFVDEPREVADGRTLFIFTIPIIMSSVLLRPSSSFVFAALCSAEVTLVSAFIPKAPNIPALIGFMTVAFISWLSARSLANALKELMLINKELDKRVADRTQALAEALARVQTEAGKNQAILESIADGVVVFNNEDRAIVANPAIEELMGLELSRVLGSNMREMLTAGHITDQECETVQKMLYNPSAANGTVKLVWGKKTLAVNAAPVKTLEGEMIGKVAVFHDYTREAEIDRMKSDFVAMVSHELRTPLSAILGYSEMLHEGVYGKVSPGQGGAVNRIMANSRRLLSLVNDLLDQAQIEAGKLTFHNREFQPGELLEHLNSVMETIIQAKGLRLKTAIADDVPAFLYGDPQRLNQVLVNLVNNAVKFTDKGFVMVRFYLPDDHHWGIEVKDTGLGISAEAQKYIFEPFRQANMDVTRQFGGIGLGLSIVKRLINMMEGEIYLNSHEGQGSIFTIILPMKSAPEIMNSQEKV